MAKSAVVLLSGGIDSAVSAYIAKNVDRYVVHGLTLDYGQRHRAEIDAARKIAEHIGFDSHVVVHAPLNRFCQVPLLGFGSVAENRSVEDIVGGLSPMYVPARNSVFLAFALSLAEVKGSERIFIGANKDDAAGFPDCRREFFDAWEKLARLGTTAHAVGLDVHVRAPLIELTKREIIEKAYRWGIDLKVTLSCYQPTKDGAPCHKCDACILRDSALQSVNDEFVRRATEMAQDLCLRGYDMADVQEAISRAFPFYAGSGSEEIVEAVFSKGEEE